MPEWFLEALERECGITAPRRPGYDTVDAIHAMHEGRARVLIGLGGNFLQASPDTGFTAAALAKCDLTCHVSTKLNRSHLVTGRTALILPCLGRSERDGDGRFVTTENSMGVVQMSCGVLAPAAPHLLSEIEIVARMAEAVLGAEGPVLWRWLAEDYGRIRSLISQVVPGFDDYSMRASKPGGFHLPNNARERVWNTRNGKVNFSVGAVGSFSASEGRLVLQTLRSHDQFNTTIYGPDDRYRGISNARRIILVCPEDLIERGIRPGEKVDITSFWNDEERRIERFTALPYEMPKGCAAAYFPEANVLVPIDSRADGSGTPTSKAIEIEIRRSD
jgi:molybdopterin-dependent oxidoreductase alpha subunit